MNEQKPTNLQAVTIYKPHTHKGKRLLPGPEGIQIHVTEQDAKFLKSVGALDKPAPMPSTEAAATKPGELPAAGGVSATTPHGSTRPIG